MCGSARELLPVPQFPQVQAAVGGSPQGFQGFPSFAVFVSRELPSEAQQVQTQLHRSCSEDFYTYHNVPWKIFIRKEVQIMGTLGDRSVPRSYWDKGGLHQALLYLLAGFLPQGQHQQPTAARPHLPAGEALIWPHSPLESPGRWGIPQWGDDLLIPLWPSGAGAVASWSWGAFCSSPHTPTAPHPLSQIFNDVLSDTCIRISQEERLRLKSLFGNPVSRCSLPEAHTQPVLISWVSPSQDSA